MPILPVNLGRMAPTTGRAQQFNEGKFKLSQYSDRASASTSIANVNKSANNSGPTTSVFRSSNQSTGPSTSVAHGPNQNTGDYGSSDPSVRDRLRGTYIRQLMLDKKAKAEAEAKKGSLNGKIQVPVGGSFTSTKFNKVWNKEMVGHRGKYSHMTAEEKNLTKDLYKNKLSKIGTGKEIGYLTKKNIKSAAQKMYDSGKISSSAMKTAKGLIDKFTT